MLIKKNGNGFLISDKKINFSIESHSSNSDFETSSKEIKKDNKKTIFDWPGEYEKNGVELKGVEISDHGVVSFNIKVGKIRITHLPENLNDMNKDVMDKMDEVDVLLVTFGKDTDIKILKSLINKFEPRITIFGGDNRNQGSEISQNCQLVEDLKIGSLPIDKSEYYILT